MNPAGGKKKENPTRNPYFIVEKKRHLPGESQTSQDAESSTDCWVQLLQLSIQEVQSTVEKLRSHRGQGRDEVLERGTHSENHRSVAEAATAPCALRAEV